MSTIDASGVLYFRVNNIQQFQYSYNDSTWTTVSVWPVTIVNTNLSETLKVFFKKEPRDIELASNNHYFICGSDNIQFGNTSLNSDGTRPIIKLGTGYTINNYPGFIQNGTFEYSGKNNITIVNLFLDGTGITLSDGGGWIGQRFFGANTSGNKIINCSSKGNITNGSGGIIGGDSSGISIKACSSSGNIGVNGGGIIGPYSNDTTATECFSIGQIVASAGGIFGYSCFQCNAIKCYSIGNIIGINAGGIFGETTSSNNNSINCYSQGDIIGSGAGGIFGSDTTFTSEATAIKCYSKGEMRTNTGGIIGALGNLFIANNCYTSGLSLDGSINGIYRGNNQDNAQGTGNYSEANSGGNTGAWNDTNAQATLGEFGTTWLSLSPNTPFVLGAFGASPYTLDNVDPNTYDLVKTFSQTVTAGSSTISCKAANYKTFQIMSGGNPTITIDNSGQITTTTATPPGIYELVIYGVDDYTTTEFILTVTGSPIPPTPTLSSNLIIFPCCPLNMNVADSITTNKSNEILATNVSGKTVLQYVNRLYTAVNTGSKTYYATPIFNSYADYILYLQGKNS
jgi:hypothetical protein